MKFGPERRVRKRPEFQSIQRQGRRVTTAHFVWIIARAPSPDTACRLGITASKKVGNSVHRSRVKRVVRAGFRQLEGMLPAGFDLVVICLKDSPRMGSETLVQEWQSAQKRVQKALRQLESRSSRAGSR